MRRAQHFGYPCRIVCSLFCSRRFSCICNAIALAQFPQSDFSMASSATLHGLDDSIVQRIVATHHKIDLRKGVAASLVAAFPHLYFLGVCAVPLSEVGPNDSVLLAVDRTSSCIVVVKHGETGELKHLEQATLALARLPSSSSRIPRIPGVHSPRNSDSTFVMDWIDGLVCQCLIISTAV